MKKISDQLMDGEGARSAYLGPNPWFHLVVDSVRAAERQGVDPLPILSAAILLMHHQIGDLTNRLIEAKANEAPPDRVDLGDLRNIGA